jgi:hypothetical protein
MEFLWIVNTESYYMSRFIGLEQSKPLLGQIKSQIAILGRPFPSLALRREANLEAGVRLCDLNFVAKPTGTDRVLVRRAPTTGNSRRNLPP